MRRMTLALVLIAAACSGGGAGGPETTVASTVTTTTVAASPGDDLGYRWQVGDCVLIEDPEDLPYEPYGREMIVDCAEPHSYEVYFTDTFTEGDGEPFPEDLGVRVREACVAAFAGFVGLHLAESGLDVIFYLPDRDEWSRGLRYQACVAFDPRSDGDVPHSEGTLRGSAVPLEREPGQCLEGTGVRTSVVDCATPHRGEVIGSFTHQGGPGAPYPGFERYRAAADAACADLLADYVAEPRSGLLVLPLAAGSSLTAVEWEAGLRTVFCSVVVVDAERSPLPVVGSLGEAGWWVLEGGVAA